MFKNIKLTAELEEYGKIQLKLKKDKSFEIEENDYIKGRIMFEQCDMSYIIKSDIETVCFPPYAYFQSFDSVKGLVLEIEAEDVGFKGLSIERFNPFWTKPKFFNDFTQLADNTQQILIEKNNEYIHIMPISSAQVMACARASDSKNVLRLTAGTYYGGCTQMKGEIAIISKSDNPYKAVEMSYNTACKNGVIITPKKEEKSYPQMLEGLGWCTWDAFYHDVTAKGIEDKLKEFKEKDIPIKWIMIDDGWAQVENYKLKSGYVDKTKFPQGFKTFISHIKAEYGIEYVGIWHAFTGYWFGIDKTGEVYADERQSFAKNNAGMVLPGSSYEQAYKFYSEWHKYLKAEGIDFLKVDTQGNGLEFYRNTPKAGQSVINMHNALEKSVAENFDGVMINCMGMGSLDMFSREKSCMVRNSDDFFPNKKDGFESHITQNAYNAIFSDNLFYCDYDMWWTKHFSAKQSSVLRAISGGPIYISDEIGNTDKEYLLPLIDEKGMIYRCDNAAKPTADCIFNNPHGGVLKIFNTVGEDIAIAVFNLSDKKQSVKINLSDVYASGDYYMHMYFEQKCDNFKDGMILEIEPNDTEVINLYKITNNAYTLGDTNKYVSIAAK